MDSDREPGASIGNEGAKVPNVQKLQSAGTQDQQQLGCLPHESASSDLHGRSHGSRADTYASCRSDSGQETVCAPSSTSGPMSLENLDRAVFPRNDSTDNENMPGDVQEGSVLSSSDSTKTDTTLSSHAGTSTISSKQYVDRLREETRVSVSAAEKMNPDLPKCSDDKSKANPSDRLKNDDTIDQEHNEIVALSATESLPSGSTPQVAGGTSNDSSFSDLPIESPEPIQGVSDSAKIVNQFGPEASVLQATRRASRSSSSTGIASEPGSPVETTSSRRDTVSVSVAVQCSVSGVKKEASVAVLGTVSKCRQDFRQREDGRVESTVEMCQTHFAVAKRQQTPSTTKINVRSELPARGPPVLEVEFRADVKTPNPQPTPDQLVEIRPAADEEIGDRNTRESPALPVPVRIPDSSFRSYLRLPLPGYLEMRLPKGVVVTCLVLLIVVLIFIGGVLFYHLDGWYLLAGICTLFAIAWPILIAIKKILPLED